MSLTTILGSLLWRAQEAEVQRRHWPIAGRMESLRRVNTVQQNSMAATSLPLELQQQVYSFLHSRSFHAARNVCRYWRFASLDAVTLSKQLAKLPILRPEEGMKGTPLDLQKAWAEAASKLMLGIRVSREQDDQVNDVMDRVGGPRIASARSRDGRRLVTVNGRNIAVYDTSPGLETPNLLLQRPLNDLKETAGSGPWLNLSRSNAYYELALSSSGKLLAVAQERIAQIYNLEADSTSWTVNQHLQHAAGHFVCGLNFEQDDHVLRVSMSGKGAVLYLGCPPGPPNGQLADMGHWRSDAGLRHHLLDSSLLTLPFDQSKVPAASAPRLGGLQLLRPLGESGYLFAAQRHGGGESSHYVLGHVRVFSPTLSPKSTPPGAKPATVKILVRLESFLSAWDYTLSSSSVSDPSAPAGMGKWENMPSAHEHHPSYSLAQDGKWLLLAERDKKAIRPVPLTGLFLYRVPDLQDLERSLVREGKRNDREKFLDSLERKGATTLEYKVPRLPICLSTVKGTVHSMELEQEGEGPVKLNVETQEMRRRWIAEEMC